MREAQASKAPLQRLADRYAVWFTPLTVALCAVAAVASGDPVRALAVLVVATPCPLLLAAPVAIIGGVNTAARRFVIVRHGGALEQLSRVDSVVFDKTGTLTLGKPRVQAVRVAEDFDASRVMNAAAAVEQRSSHLLARVLVDSVRAGGAELPDASDIVEAAGQGVSGIVNGQQIRVGSRAYALAGCLPEAGELERLERDDGGLCAYVAIGTRLAAVIEYADELRPEIHEVLESLRRLGVRRLALLSGDRASTAERFAHLANISEAHGDMRPADKATFVRERQAAGETVMMVGDGINDAPALSSADVGVALAAHGASISAEAADVIVLDDALTRIPQAIAISRHAMRVARQSIGVGLGLSAGAMIAAAFGLLPPLLGAGLQEAIDVAVILNALRAAAMPRAAAMAPAVGDSRSQADRSADRPSAERLTEAGGRAAELPLVRQRVVR